MNQSDQSVIVSRATPLVFGNEEWLMVSSKLKYVSNELQTLLHSIKDPLPLE